jgi:hypothetical protein
VIEFTTRTPHPTTVVIGLFVFPGGVDDVGVPLGVELAIGVVTVGVADDVGAAAAGGSCARAT